MPENFQKLGRAVRFLGGVLMLLGGVHSLLTLGFLNARGMVQHAGPWLGVSLWLGVLVTFLGLGLGRAGRRLQAGEAAALAPLGASLYGLAALLLLGLGSLLLGEFLLWVMTWAPAFGGC